MAPDILNPYFPQIARGIEDEAHERGYTMVLGNLDRATGKAERFVQFLRDHQIEQVILTGGGVITPAFWQIWSDLAQNVRMVSIGRHNLDCPSVTIDEVVAGKQAVEYLVGLGHRKIAMICGPSHSIPALDRLEGYMTVLFENQIPYSSDWIIEGDFCAPSGYAAGKELLNRNPCPSAVFCSNDLMALGLMRAVKEACLRIPDDISVVGFDHLATLEYSLIRLTSVAVPMAEMGRQAVKLLMDGDSQSPKSSLVLPTNVWVGETTATFQPQQPSGEA
jgi:DNA-binding LacI/PurR family transcriptional regulator